MDEFKKKFLAEDLSMSPRDKAKRNRIVRKKLNEELRRQEKEREPYGSLSRCAA